jgi:hypothetical protein
MDCGLTQFHLEVVVLLQNSLGRLYGLVLCLCILDALQLMHLVNKELVSVV